MTVPSGASPPEQQSLSAHQEDDGSEAGAARGASRKEKPDAARDEALYVFVYGTLMSGQPAEGYLGGLRRWPATTTGQLFRTPGNYPALVPAEDGRPITGEVVRLEGPSRLPVLDLFERVADGLYKRRRIPVLSMGRPGEAWAWVVDADTARRRRYAPMRTGDWRTVASRS